MTDAYAEVLTDKMAARIVNRLRNARVILEDGSEGEYVYTRVEYNPERKEIRATLPVTLKEIRLCYAENV